MAYQESVAVRNAKLEAIETVIGTAPLLIFYSGAEAANCAAADPAGVLATMTLPSDWMANASGGIKALAGTWQDPSADNTGTLASWRIKDSSGTTCHMQGNVTVTGGGGQITVASLSVTAAQPFSILTFTLTAGNA